jgi:hypothetical protein
VFCSSQEYFVERLQIRGVICVSQKYVFLVLFVFIYLHYKDREAAQKTHVERYNIKKLSEMEVRKQFQIERGEVHTGF